MPFTNAMMGYPYLFTTCFVASTHTECQSERVNADTHTECQSGELMLN